MDNTTVVFVPGISQGAPVLQVFSVKTDSDSSRTPSTESDECISIEPLAASTGCNDCSGPHVFSHLYRSSHSQWLAEQSYRVLKEDSESATPGKSTWTIEHTLRIIPDGDTCLRRYVLGRELASATFVRTYECSKGRNQAPPFNRSSWRVLYSDLPPRPSLMASLMAFLFPGLFSESNRKCELPEL
jgi:hypothetical protein